MSKITLKNFAAMTVSYLQYSLDYTLDSLAEIGIRNIDLWGGTPHYYRYDRNDKERIEFLETLQKKAVQRGLNFVVYTPETLNYPYAIADPDPCTRKRTIDYFSECMDDAIVLGIDKLFINTGTGLRDLPIQTSTDYCIDSLKKICAIAQTKGITMLLEQLQPYESNICHNIEQMKQIIQAVDSKALKICVDLTAMSSAEQLDEVKKGYEAIANVIGEEPPHVMRAPGGNFYGSIIDTLWDTVDAEIGWDVDTEDWRRPGADAIAATILTVQPGQVILMHDGGGDRSQTVEGLRMALPQLVEQGYSFVTIDELIAYGAPDGVSLRPA